MNDDLRKAESEAYRHWLGFMMLHVASGEPCMPEHIHDQLRRLEGDPNFAALEQIAVDIQERFVAYINSGNPDDLWLRD